MKSLRILPLAVILFFASCEKETIPTPNTPAPSTLHVEYRVTSVSGAVTIEQLIPGTGTNNTEKFDVNRPTYSVEFDAASGTQVFLGARNQNNGPDEVIAEIYVNGTLTFSGSANAMGAVARAEGTIY